MIIGSSLLLATAIKPPDDYIHHYTFDNISGGSLIDEGSAGVNGTINAGVTTGAKGAIGESAYFSSLDTSNITVTGHNFWTSAFTFTVLVYLDEQNLVTPKSIYTSGESLSTAADRDFDIYVRPNNDGIGCIFSDGTDYLAIVNGTTPVPEKQWFMVTVKWDGTTSTNGITIKVNDVVDVQGTMSAGAPATTYTPRIGGFNTAAEYEWLGLQDHIKIYDRFLSDAEDTANYNEWGYSQVISGVPTPTDDNEIFELDTSTATGWSGGAVSSDGTDLTFTASGSPVTSEKTIQGPSFGDYIMYLTVSGENASGSAVNIVLGGAGTDGALNVTLGYNWETAAYELNRVSLRINGVTGIAGPIVDFSAAPVEFAVQYDSKVGAGNFFIKESGSWVFYGSASMSDPYKNKLRLASGGGHVNDATISEWFIAYPNYAVLGDSIAEGATLFSPNPADYAGDDNYESTWMYWANGIGSTLRNNLIVNYGVGSEDSADLLVRVNDTILKTQCRTLFLHASSNDFSSSINNTDRTTNIQASIDRAKIWDDLQVVLLNAVYPNSSSPNHPGNADQYRDWWTNNQPSIVRASSKLDIMGGSTILDGNYMDTIYTQSDGVHPNVAGYELIGDYIEAQE